MRHSFSFNFPIIGAYVAAITIAVLCWQSATSALAKPAQQRSTPPPLPLQKPLQADPLARLSPAPLPGNLRAHKPKPAAQLGPMDEIATLHAIHQALTSVGDGGAYVWRRGNGRLTGLFRPTTSFKSATGEICRHIIIRLNSREYSREVEGIACRDVTGVWQLSG